MMTVGIAIRLGLRPADVAEWPMEELAAVMGYLELENEAVRESHRAAPRSAGSEPPRRIIYEVKGKSP